MVKTQILLEERQLEALRKMAVSSGQSIADLVRQAVDRLLDSHAGVSREQLVERA